MPTALGYAGGNSERFLAELEDLTRIPSISTDPAYAGEVERAATWLGAGKAWPINLKVVIEGEEGLGSRNFMSWVRANAQRLKADCVHNPAQVVAEMVAKLHDSQGRVSVPRFYDDVEELSDEERAELNKEVIHVDDFHREVGAPVRVLLRTFTYEWRDAPRFHRRGSSIPVAQIPV
ncbi:MAG: hypothetical protein GVY29_11020 [Spirochaetes bacterium]|jgi:acetylornithine deacetylase/succinyl-diaminopimelate desuccinylase-like protein|nr:hypothetical protein [Spirochaetota bacterium]